MADILIVEDDAELAVTLGELLSLDEHTTRIAFNGVEGLRAVDARLPDVILLDFEMPVLDGRGMVEGLVEKDEGRELIPIVLSSGYAGIVELAESLGTNYWIAKPCSLEALETIIGRALVERCPPSPTKPTLNTAEHMNETRHPAH